MSELTQDYLKTLLRYEPENGCFFWTKARRGRCAADGAAGNINSPGYRCIMIDGKTHYAHRLAWLYMTGTAANGVVDHINHERADNRWENLREVTQAENLKNTGMSSSNNSGINGVCWYKSKKKWRVSITVDGRQIYGGDYDSLEDAKARREYLSSLHGFHVNHGRAQG